VLKVVSEVMGVKESIFRERRRNSPWRGVAAKSLVAYVGLTQRATAELLGMGTGAAVSAQIGMLSERLKSDRKLANQLKTINRRLDEDRKG
jgi:predicted transcriptional regulator